MSGPALTRGLSSLEILVGLALGFLLLTPLVQMASSQWSGLRQWSTDLKLQQSLRAVANAMASDLRRAGSWSWADRAIPGSSGGINPYAVLQVTDGGGLTDGVSYAYTHPKRAEDGVLTDDERLGWRLRNGVIESQLGQGNWQALSDPQRVRITRLKLSLQSHTQTLPCARACTTPAAGSALESPCPPVQTMRTAWIDLAGQTPPSSSWVSSRSLQTAVQLRNDTWAGACRD